MQESIGFCSVCGNASKLLRMIFHNNKWYCRECFYKEVEKRECKTCKNPYCSRPIEERQKQEVQHHFQYGWECSDKEKYLQDDGGFVLVKKERITELEATNKKISDECHKLVDTLEMKQKEHNQLTKAKEIIEGLMRFCRCFAQHHTEDIRYKDAEQFLREQE